MAWQLRLPILRHEGRRLLLLLLLLLPPLVSPLLLLLLLLRLHALARHLDLLLLLLLLCLHALAWHLALLKRPRRPCTRRCFRYPTAVQPPQGKPSTGLYTRQMPS